MGGITNTRAFATRYGPNGLGLPLAGLYDVGEESVLRRGLAAAGLPGAVEPGGPERLGFYACSSDLEDELIRALGVDGVEAVIAAAGEAQSLRLLTGMPAQRGWTRVEVLRRFLGSQSGRKARYAALFVRALAPRSGARAVGRGAGPKHLALHPLAAQLRPLDLGAGVHDDVEPGGPGPLGRRLRRPRRAAARRRRSAGGPCCG